MASLSQDRANPEMLTLLGSVYLSAGQSKQALTCLQQSFVLNRYDSKTGELLSRTIRSLGAHDQNRRLLESSKFTAGQKRFVRILRSFEGLA